MAGKTELLEYIVNPLKRFGLNIVGACRDLLPIILVILIFQLAVVRQPFPMSWMYSSDLFSSF